MPRGGGPKGRRGGTGSLMYLILHLMYRVASHILLLLIMAVITGLAVRMTRIAGPYGRSSYTRCANAHVRNVRFGYNVRYVLAEDLCAPSQRRMLNRTLPRCWMMHSGARSLSDVNRVIRRC